MAIIVPAILPKSLSELTDTLTKLSGIAEDVQIDIVDGQFASPPTWPYATDPAEPSRMLAEGTLLPRCGEFKFEIDLMSTDPESVTGTWIGLCATRVTVHAESTRFIGRFLENARSLYGHDKDFAPGLLSLGLSIGIETDTALIEPYLDRIDYVQFMGIRAIGRQGEPFDSRVLPKIASFRKKHPAIPIQVDGGVSLQTAPKLLDAGVSRLIVGSALLKAPDMRAEYQKFLELTERHGIFG